MSYILNNYDGTQLVVLADGTLDTSTSITLVGRNYVGYGTAQNENFLYLLQNFANDTAPLRPIRGQTWFNTTTTILNVFDGTAWHPVGAATRSTTAPESPYPGELWFKIPDNQLYAYDGTQWVFIGPEGVTGFGATRAQADTLLDASLAPHPVIFFKVNGTISAIVSTDTFTIDPNTAPEGFSNISPGINIKNGHRVIGNLTGIADKALVLNTPRNINGVSFNGSADITITASSPNRLVNGQFLIGQDYDGSIQQTWSVDASSANIIGKVVARDSTGSFAAGRITANTGFTGNLTGNVTGNVTGDITAGDITASNYVSTNLINAGQIKSLDGLRLIIDNNYSNGSDTRSRFYGVLQGDVNATAIQTRTLQASTTVTATGGFFGALTGNSSGTHTGPVTGNVTGNLTGNSSGTHTGPVFGNVTGNVTGNTTGLHTGNVTGNVSGNLAGNVTGNVVGNVTGDTSGTHTGPVIGNVTGNVSGNLAGNSTGLHTGNVVGNVTGNLTGNADTVTDGMYLSQAQTVTGAKTFSSPMVVNNNFTATGTTTLGTTTVSNLTAQAGNYQNAIIKFQSFTDNGNTTTITTLNTSGSWTDGNTNNSILPTQRAIKTYVDNRVNGVAASIPPVPQANFQDIVKTIVGTVDLLMSTSNVNYTIGSGISPYSGSYTTWQSSIFSPGGINSKTAQTTVYGTGNGDPSINLTIDLGQVFGLSNNPSDLTWKGNYDFNIAPSLTRVDDRRQTRYGMGQGNWSVTAFSLSNDPNNGNYGKFRLCVSVIDIGHPYHGTNVQAGWLGIASRGRNTNGL